MTADLAVLAALGVAALVGAALVRPGAALCVSVALGVTQIFLTTHVTVSAASLWLAATWITVLRHRSELPRLQFLSGAYALLVVVSVAVLVWSPDRTAGANLIVQLIGLGATVALAAIVARAAPRAADLAYTILAVLAVVSAVTTIAFRLWPDVENGFFHSSLFGFLDGHETAAGFFTTQRNNVLDTTKSGGFFFVNANVGSLFQGTTAALLSGLACRAQGGRRLFLAGIAVLSLVATLATGSKTGLYVMSAALIAVGAVVLVLQRTPRARPARWLPGGGLILAGAAVVLLPLLVTAVSAMPQAHHGTPTASQLAAPARSSHASATAGPTSASADLAAQSADSVGMRLQIWRIALIVFEHRPLGTLGFGGWLGQYSPLAQARGLNPTFPPHNWVIDTWFATGPAGLLATGLILAAVGALAWRRVRESRDGSFGARMIPVLSIVVFGWVLVHGLADNTGFYGGARLIPVVALAMAPLLAGPRSHGRLDRAAERAERADVPLSAESPAGGAIR